MAALHESPDLFPDFHRFTHYHEKRAYVLGILVEKARRGPDEALRRDEHAQEDDQDDDDYRGGFTRRSRRKPAAVELADDDREEIFLPDLFNHEVAVLNMIASVLLGVSRQGGRQVAHQPVPVELQRYRVGIKSIQSRGKLWPIAWKGGHAHSKIINRRVGNMEKKNVQILKPFYRQPADAKAQDRFVAVVPLPEAWRIMQQHGVQCFYASTGRRQDRHWRYQQVPVSEALAAIADGETKAKPKKRGNKASQAAAATA